MSDTGQTSRLDAVARDLAAGRISRRSAVGRLAAGFFGLAAASGTGAVVSEVASAACPPARRCKGRCCPPKSRCRKGRCRCIRRYTKCGGRCVNLRSDRKNCGRCGRRCPAGKVCRSGRCVATATQAVCGNGVKEGSEQCDGTDFGGATCTSLGFAGGTLACTANCTFDASGCTPAQSCTPNQFLRCEGGAAVYCSSTGNSEVQVVVDDGNDCTIDTCSPPHGISRTPAPAGTVCGPTSQGVCNGSGACVGCNAAADCPGQDTECRSRVCNSGTCGFAFAPAGTSVSSQVSGDCQANVCDGNGNTTTQVDDSDIPQPQSPCHTGACQNGVPVQIPSSPGTICGPGTCTNSTHTSQVCDGSGGCVAGSQQSCSPYTCNAAGTACVTTCSSDSQCASTHFCNAGGQCVPKLGTGQSCTTNSQCQNSNCSGGVCGCTTDSQCPGFTPQSCGQGIGCVGGNCVQTKNFGSCSAGLTCCDGHCFQFCP